MPTLIENLYSIDAIKSDIKSAIEAKGVDMTSASFADYPSKIGDITTSFVTETLSVSVNGTYTPGQGVDGYSQVNVSVPDGDGTWSNPYNVLDAINVINGSPEGTSSMYVRAFVTAISSAYSQTGNYGNADFHVGISGSNYLRAYRLNYFDGKKYNSYPGEASKPDIHIGDEVIMYGQFKMYNNTPQTVANAAYLYAINGVYDISVGPGTEYYIEQNGSYSSLNYYDFITVDVTAPVPVTESLSVSVNGTYTPGQGVDGFSQVVVSVPQSVIGYTQKDITEKNVVIVNLSNSASFVASEVFFYSSTIQTISLPNCTYIGRVAFAGCSNLTDVYVPICQKIQDGAFQNCTHLTEINLPNCTNLGPSIFLFCTDLSYASVCMTTSSIAVAVFKSTGLTSVYFDGPFIGHYTFEKCMNLSEIYLGSTSVTVLGEGTFVSTPIASGTGSIYVPASLVSDYQNDSNWSSYSSQIFPIPE